MFVGLSEAAAVAHPTLCAWLAGAGLPAGRIDPTGVSGRDSRRLLDIAEAGLAQHGDILVERADGAASLTAGRPGRPALLRYDFADMPFAHALAAELVRPRHRPACGEPESATFLRLAERIAASDATALILGETGTGKEGLARFLHAGSARADKPFVAVNCAALPETMLEAMLFGHQKGSFTGAGAAGEGLFRAAEGGTLFLDEVAELPIALQAKLLRAIQEREVLPVGATRAVPVDIRIVAAANKDLAGEVAAGRFRADLYWRLNVMPLTLKPLRERRQDVRAITAALLLRHLPAGQALPWPTAAALDKLMAHDWPGNVRELENVIQRALLLREGDRIEAGDLAIDGPAIAPVRQPQLQADTIEIATPVATLATGPARLAEVTRALQAQAIREALVATGGSRIRAAQRLGISERTLRYRLADMREAA
ncbi:sigma 54-interacting transcriptional regulator [Sphingomonas sp. 1P06PA]|uniref:sigma-54 interaction domain-containing protein n=1 Tax=Sphingomonas sp. 1P06PA TaxID=554121 RepID=UPI0039A71CDA